MHALFLPNFHLTHSLNHNCSQPELDKWLEVLNRAIYGPRGGGMFGNELRVQVRRKVRVLSQYISMSSYMYRGGIRVDREADTAQYR
jgi:hypothetical protein